MIVVYLVVGLNYCVNARTNYTVIPEHNTLKICTYIEYLAYLRTYTVIRITLELGGKLHSTARTNYNVIE